MNVTEILIESSLNDAARATAQLEESYNNLHKIIQEIALRDFREC